MGLAIVKRYHSAQGTLLLRHFFRNQMGCLGWIWAEMECLSALLYFAILRRDPFVLPQMIGPRFSHKALDVSLRIRCVAKQVPADRAVALTYPLHLFHCFEEFLGSFLIDSIFNRSNSWSLRRFGIDHHYRLGPMHRRSERQILIARETKAPRRQGSDEQTNRGNYQRGRNTEAPRHQTPDGATGS